MLVLRVCNWIRTTRTVPLKYPCQSTLSTRCTNSNRPHHIAQNILRTNGPYPHMAKSNNMSNPTTTPHYSIKPISDKFNRLSGLSSTTLVHLTPPQEWHLGRSCLNSPKPPKTRQRKSRAYSTTSQRIPTHPDAKICFHKSDMKLEMHSNAAYLVETKALHRREER